MRIIKNFGLPIVLLVLVLTSACGSPAPAATPVPTAVPVPAPLCSLVVPGPESGMSMTRILEKLGMNYTSDDPILLIDGARGTKSHMPQPGEVISLEVPLANCTGPTILARQYNFAVPSTQTFAISGFQSPIDATRAIQAFAYTCELTRWFEANGLRFSGDIYDGCNYATSVYVSYADGTSSCTPYATFTEAYEDVVETDLSSLKWLSIVSDGIIVEQNTATPNYCPSNP